MGGSTRRIVLSGPNGRFSCFIGSPAASAGVIGPAPRSIAGRSSAQRTGYRLRPTIRGAESMRSPEATRCPHRSSPRDTGCRSGSWPQPGPRDREERGLFGNLESHGSRCRPILMRSVATNSHAPRRNFGSGYTGDDPSSTSKNGRKVGGGKSKGCDLGGWLSDERSFTQSTCRASSHHFGAVRFAALAVPIDRSDLQSRPMVSVIAELEPIAIVYTGVRTTLRDTRVY